jgi:hypothetical protein
VSFAAGAAARAEFNLRQSFVSSEESVHNCHCVPYPPLVVRDEEHTKVPLKAESLYPTITVPPNATAAFQAPALLGRKV